MLSKILIFLIGMAVGILVMMYNRFFAHLVGTNSFAEKTFGGGGTYIMWQLIGLLIVIITIVYIFGGMDAILGFLPKTKMNL